MNEGLSTNDYVSISSVGIITLILNVTQLSNMFNENKRNGKFCKHNELKETSGRETNSFFINSYSPLLLCRLRVASVEFFNISIQREKIDGKL